ncbi:helix-turn-helix domain-containing protein [Ramlibacter terrae]|uniref:Helix-turn-helix domain-containing protein n=1 Tax=Ramlibacter terrae TaxID=2732511 RepID=A0ABX6P669_9BURK|nr:helix-turn-helix domain-containing protein [Ramlibacter terrae]
MGLPPATWLRIRRWEVAVGALAGHETTSRAELSLRHGFSDQAHLARDTRAIADASPACHGLVRQWRGLLPLCVLRGALPWYGAG